MLVFLALVHDFEGQLAIRFLGPLDDPAFVVGDGVDELLEVEVGDDQFLDDKALAKLEALVEINGTNQSLKGVPIDGFGRER